MLFVHSTTGNNLFFSILAFFPGLTWSLVGLLLMVKPQLVSPRQLVPESPEEASTSTRLIPHVKELLANKTRIQTTPYNPESQMRSCSFPSDNPAPRSRNSLTLGRLYMAPWAQLAIFTKTAWTSHLSHSNPLISLSCSYNLRPDPGIP